MTSGWQTSPLTHTQQLLLAGAATEQTREKQGKAPRSSGPSVCAQVQHLHLPLPSPSKSSGHLSHIPLLGGHLQAVLPGCPQPLVHPRCAVVNTGRTAAEPRPSAQRRLQESHLCKRACGPGQGSARCRPSAEPSQGQKAEWVRGRDPHSQAAKQLSGGAAPCPSPASSSPQQLWHSLAPGGAELGLRAWGMGCDPHAPCPALPYCH